MAKELLERLYGRVDRRTAIGRLLLGSAAFAAGLFGIAPGAYACAACCSLCKDPTTCTYGPCGCQWSWACCDGVQPGTGWRWSCKECYPADPPCDCCSCSAVSCSAATHIGTCG